MYVCMYVCMYWMKYEILAFDTAEKDFLLSFMII